MTTTFSHTGSGSQALLLLPGWCSTSAVFQPIAGELSGRHRVVGIDWRGHGVSRGEAADFGFDELSQDLFDIASSLEGDLVAVAISHAGWPAIDLCRRMPGRVKGLILIDWIVLDPPPPFIDALGALQNEHAWRDVRGKLFAMWRGDPADRAVSEYLERDMAPFGFEMWSRAGREIAHAYERYRSPLAALTALPDPPKVRHIYAQPDDAGYLAAQQSFAIEHAWFSVAKLDARTHFPSIEMPKSLIAEIRRFLS